MSVRLLAVLTAVALAVPAIAAAATRNGITPLSPKPGATVPLAKDVTFRMRVRGKGKVFVHVCRSGRRSKKEGVICNRALITQAKQRGSNFVARGRFFDHPGDWLNNPGTYYWQAHRIDCTGDISDCKREGPVVRFKVG